ncbi:MAG: DMT family transporter [Lachnospiraceae bacterium]
MKLKQIRGGLLLLLAAVLWGSTFVAQSVGMDYIGPFTYLFCRSLVGCIFLLPVAYFYEKFVHSKEYPAGGLSPSEKQSNRKTLFIGGLLCGLILTLASVFQQIGIQFTSVGKTGFITALYIVLVPVLGLFLKKKCGVNVWVSVGIAVIGLYLLCINGSFSIAKGDAFVLVCSVLFAIHILVIDHFSPKVNGVMLSCIQFAICGILCAIPMVLIEKPQISAILPAWWSILYAGILSSGVGFTCQIIGQKHLSPAVSSLILSLESVVSVLAGWIVLHEELSPREIIGCVIMFAAILLAQISWPSRKKKTAC